MDVDEFIGQPADEVPTREPTSDDCNGKRTESRDGVSVFTGYCKSTPGRGTDHVGEGRCKHHGGASTGAPEGNNNAATHGAYSKSFVEDFLTNEEIERVEQAQELLETPEGAQSHARLLAAIAIEQYRRSGDERFLRRYESLCDKAEIFPTDEVDVNHQGLEEAFMSNLREYHEEP